MYIRREEAIYELVRDETRTVGELATVAKELRELVADPVDALAKDDILDQAQLDAHYGPAVEMNYTMQRLTNVLGKHLARLSGATEANDHKSATPSPEGLVGFMLQPGNHVIDLAEWMDVSTWTDEHFQKLLQNTTDGLLAMAMHAADTMAESYRGCDVGAVGFYRDATGRYVGIFMTGNLKEHDLQPKACAEMRNLYEVASFNQESRATGSDIIFSHCTGLRVYSEVTQVDMTEEPTEVLPPCKNCIRELYTNPLVDDKTDIVCENGDGQRAHFSLPELIAKAAFEA